MPGPRPEDRSGSSALRSLSGQGTSCRAHARRGDAGACNATTQERGRRPQCHRVLCTGIRSSASNAQPGRGGAYKIKKMSRETQKGGREGFLVSLEQGHLSRRAGRHADVYETDQVIGGEYSVKLCRFKVRNARGKRAKEGVESKNRSRVRGKRKNLRLIHCVGPLIVQIEEGGRKAAGSKYVRNVGLGCQKVA